MSTTFQRRERRTDGPVGPAPISAVALQGIDTVIIDVGDVLLPTSRASQAAKRLFHDRLRSDTRVSMDDIRAGMAALPSQDLMTQPYLLNDHKALRDKIGHGDLVEEFAPLRRQVQRQFLDQIQVDPDIKHAVKQLKADGKKVILITDLPESTAKFVLHGAGLGGLADQTYARHDVPPDAPAAAPMAEGIDEPVTALPADMPDADVLDHVVAAENVVPTKTLRLATGHDCTMETAKATGMRTAMTKTFSTGGNQTDADFIVHTAKQLREAVAQAVTVSTAPVTPAARPPAAETLGASTPVARRTLQTA